MYKALFSLSIVIVALSQACLHGEAPSWPQFLGPNRDGLATEKGLASKWTANGPEVLWRAKGGIGMSGIAVADNLAVTMWNSDAGQVVVALNSQSGDQIWLTPVAREYENSMGNGPRATPTISGDRVYAYTGDGILVCLHLADGKVIWTKNVVGGVGAKAAEYGMACSPLIVGDLVIVTAGGDGSAVVAMDASTGDVRWKAVDGAAAYSSPALLMITGETQVVAFTGSGVSGISPAEGAVLWHYPFKTPYDCNTVTPISVEGKVFISSGENHGCVMLEVTKAGGSYKVEEVWSSIQVKSVMRNEWQTSAYVDGHLYGFDNVGSAGPTTHLTCVNAQTGETVWRENRFGKGNMVAADGKLWMTTMEGEFVVAEATTSRYIELGRKKLFGKTRQSPSIAGGKAYVRDDAEVVCLKIN
jgi:outer membrane protein assembly factor BamB